MFATSHACFAAGCRWVAETEITGVGWACGYHAALYRAHAEKARKKPRRRKPSWTQFDGSGGGEHPWR